MKSVEFIKNLSGLCDGNDYPVELLKVREKSYRDFQSSKLPGTSSDSSLFASFYNVFPTWCQN